MPPIQVNKGFYAAPDASMVSYPVANGTAVFQWADGSGRTGGKIYVFTDLLVWEEYAPSGASSLTKGRQAIALDDESAIIVHSLNDASAYLVSAFANWNSSQPYIIAQDANTITVAFPNSCSLSTGGELAWAISKS